MVVAGLPARATAAVLTVSAAAAVAVGGVAVAASMPWHTTYAAVSQGVVVTDVAAAVSLWGAGVVLSLERPGDVRAALLVLAAAAWVCADWIGWQGGPDVVRTLGVVGYAALLPLVAHLVARTWPRWGSLLLAVPWLYAVTLGLVVARLAVADPLVDAACWQNCTANFLLVIDQPNLAVGLLRASLVVAAVTGVTLVAGVAVATAGGPVARRQHLPVRLPAAALGAASAIQAALVLIGSVESPGDRRFVALHVAVAWALVGVGAGVGLMVVRSRRARRRTGELARNLALSRDESVASLLGRAIGDPTVTVTYRVREPEGWVDAAGHRVADPDGGAPRGVVPVMRAGELIALISHDPDTAPDLDLASALGPAARLAVENESLEAQQRSRLHDLRDSQRRIVDAADAERARLERNLHDAAQVSVLGLIDTVHRALRAAGHAGDAAAASGLVSDAAVEAKATMEELRDLARGIHPAILDLEGLAPALETLADLAQIRVEVAMSQHERLPAAVEHTVYVIAADAIREAVKRGEDDLLLRVHVAGEWLELVVDGTAQPPGDALRDRVGALGGAVLCTGKALEVRLPCA
jgi:signal transduction histidine kinase